MSSESVEISTQLGKLRGLVKTPFGNSSNTYYSFQGIPYAKPPVGELRFKTAERYGKWEAVLDATKEGNDCIQKHTFLNNLVGHEDCLYLNVYTPQKPGGGDGAKKAVMVWIHGGGFARGSGSSEIYGPDFLIEEDIVLVTINYRCGALGFIYLENETIPGNLGLRDQTLALHWVRDNISSFSGDPNNITIFGESAGAASVNFHLLSPLSRGLFHKAILQSGTSVCQWAFQSKPREKALRLASMLGCTSQDDETVLKFLRSVPAAEIINAQEHESIVTEKEKVQKFGLSFVPCVEVAGKAPFLPDYPRKMMERGEFTNVPVIMGITDKEGLLSVGLKEVSSERVNKDISVMVPHDLNISAGSDEEKGLGRKILQFYTNSDTMAWNIDTVKGYVDFITDVEFAWANELTRKWFLEQMSCPVYSYVFTYTSPRSIISAMIQTACPDFAQELLGFGSSHGDDLAHLFKSNLTQIPFVPPSSDDQVFMGKMLKAWSTFAKTGDPNCKELGVSWKRDNIQSPYFLELGTNWNETKHIIPPEREQFWKKIYTSYSYLY